MKNYLQEGCKVPVLLGSGETATVGKIFVRGNIIGVAQESGVETETVMLHTEGVFSLEKTTGTAWTQGQALYWNATTGKAITTDESGVFIGVAFAAAASGATTGEVKLNEGVKPRQDSFSVQTITAGTTGAIADTRITATSHVDITWLTNTTKSGNFKVTLSAGVGYTIDVTKDTDTTTETSAAGTVSVHIYY